MCRHWSEQNGALVSDAKLHLAIDRTTLNSLWNVETADMAFGRRLTCRLQFVWKLRTRTKQLAVRIHAPSYTANWRISRSVYQDFLACRSHLDTVGPAISPAKCAKVHFGALTVDLPAMVRLFLVARMTPSGERACVCSCMRGCKYRWVYVYVCVWGGGWGGRWVCMQLSVH